MTRLARGDPRMGAAIAATNAPAIARAAARPARRHRRLARRARGARRPGRGRPRGAARGRRATAWSRRPMDELVLVVPRDGPARTAAGWYGLRTDVLDGFEAIVAAHGRFEPRAAMEVGPDVQAGHPVPRPARRRALLPDAPHAGRRATRGCTTATRSASAGTSTPATATCSAACAASGHEELVADFEPDVRARRAAQRRHDRGRRRSTSGPSTSPTPAGGRSTSARPTSSRAASPTRDEVAAVVDRMETWSRLVVRGDCRNADAVALTPGRGRSL